MRGFPTRRLRRLRVTPILREMLGSVRLSVDELIAPLFVREGEHLQQEIPSMPGQFQYSVDTALETVRQWSEKSLRAVLLFGINDMDGIKALASGSDGVYLINKTEDTSKILQKLSISALIIIVISYVLILVGLIPRYSLSGAGKIVGIPIAASLLTLSVITISGLPVNLFVVVGLILIPGMGTDYIILLSEATSSKPTVLLSISLSMATTVLAFGLLSFTSIAGVFGLTVSIGVFTTYLLTSFFSSSILIRKQGNAFSEL